MKAVIMCGGIGSRLRPLTESVPKPLIKLMNRPVIDIIIRKLISENIKDIYLSLGYKAQDIISYCELQKYEADIKYCEEHTPLGTAGGVKNCIATSDEDILVLSGDNIFDIEIGKVYEYHKQSDADITIIGLEADDPREYGVILKDENNNILGFDEKPDWNNVRSNLINTGIYIMKGAVLNDIPAAMKYDFAGDLFRKYLDSNKIFKCRQTESYWGDMGEIEAYIRITSDLLHKKDNFITYSGTLYKEDYTDSNGYRIIAPCLIGEGTVISEGAVIGPDTVIGNKSVIGNNCVISCSVIGDSCIIGNNAEIDTAILSDNVTIYENAAVEKHVVIGYGAELGRFSRVSENCRIWPGCKAESESIVNKDIFFGTNKAEVVDMCGMSGEIFSEITLSDVLKLGQGAGCIKDIKKVGVAFEGDEAADLFKNCIMNGFRACGVDCYDFGKIYSAQVYFYSCYCELDAFALVSVFNNDITVNLYSADSFRLPHNITRNINLNCKYGILHSADYEKVGKLYDMELFSSVYRVALRKKYMTFNKDISISFECESEILRDLLNEIIISGQNNGERKVRFIFGKNGKDVYFSENNKVYSSSSVLGFLCELYCAKGKNLIIPDEAPAYIDEIGERYNCHIIRADVYNESVKKILRSELLECTWAFDAVFLAFEICAVMAECNMSLSELLENAQDCIMQKKVFTFNCSAGELHSDLIRIFGAKENNSDYAFHDNRGHVRVRQLGNSSRLRILSEAAELETAKELTSYIMDKIRLASIDN